MDSTIDILRIAAAVLALGFLASTFLVRRTDLQHHAGSVQPGAA